MTELGEDVYEAGATGGVGALIDLAAEAMAAADHMDASEWGDIYPIRARAALESLGVPLEVLAALKAGTWQAVPKQMTMQMDWSHRHANTDPAWGEGRQRAYESLLAAAPTTPTEES